MTGQEATLRVVLFVLGCLTAIALFPLAYVVALRRLMKGR